MKKGIDVTITFIIILVVGIITLAVILLFLSQQTRGGGGISSFQATQYCMQKCMQDNNAFSPSIDLSEKDEVTGDPLYENACQGIMTLAPNFCDGEEITVRQSDMTCDEITTCRITDRFGNSQVADCACP